MPDDRDRGRDLVLAPNEFAFISDETKGNINVYVGPHKTSLANTDRPVVLNYASKRFDRCSLEQATQTLAVAPEGWYLILKNPAKDASHPRTGALNNLPDLQIGRKVNVPGPISFALWPGQMVKVVQGHHIRSNQYLLVRVYDEEGAKANFQHAVFRGRDGEPDNGPAIRTEDLSMGRKLIIQGTGVAFHIPPTGIEVLIDGNGQYVREAVTLERLEYCILLDEEGNKRFVKGPAVVFPSPTEVFVEKGGSRKFRAIELNENSGIYVKVIAPYSVGGQEGESESPKAHKVGDELFITGREQMIYYPRPEHAIIKYTDQEIHYAIAIPAGEGRYVLDRDTGRITLQRGPSMFLPDPRRHVIVRRVLDTRTVQLWFPGNQEALAINQRLAEARAQEGGEAPAIQKQEIRQMQNIIAKPSGGFAGDDFNRRQSFTSPRTITLDTRYEGAVAISVWTGYAVMVVNRSGERRVIKGPHTHLLEYDETLQVLELSTGTPKSDQNLYRTVYLRVLNNKISDTVEAETRDLCRVRLSLSYRVSFENAADDDPDENRRWFNVENYVKFLTDHLRSLIRHIVKQHGVEHFYGNSVSILRDAVLGASQEGKRPGRPFEENGMRVYDVEILDVSIGDDKISQLLVGAQHSAVQQALSIGAERRRLELAQEVESTRQRVNELTSASRLNELTLLNRELQLRHEQQLNGARAVLELKQLQQQADQAGQAALTEIHQGELTRRRAAAELEGGIARQQLESRLEELRAEVEATVSKAGAVSPELIAALQAFSDRALTERVAQSMAPLAILGGESVADILAKLLKGTPLAGLLGEKSPVAP